MSVAAVAGRPDTARTCEGALVTRFCVILLPLSGFVVADCKEVAVD